MTKCSPPMTLGIFFLSFEQSSRIHREEDLQNEILNVTSKIENLEVVFWKSSIWQPSEYSNLKGSYLEYLRFKFLSEKIWFKKSTGAVFARVAYNEACRLFRRDFLRFWNKEQRYRERALSDKHFRAWVYAIDSGVDLTLILEDDIDLEGNLEETLRQAFSLIRADSPIYFNLSRGNNLSRYSKEIGNGDDPGDWFELRAADTTAAYLANRSCFQILAQEFSSRAGFKALAIDFEMSSIFLKNQTLKVMHTFHPPFSNGTIVGKYPSEIEIKNL